MKKKEVHYLERESEERSKHSSYVVFIIKGKTKILSLVWYIWQCKGMRCCSICTMIIISSEWTFFS